MNIEVMKLAAEFNRYFISANGVDVPVKVSVSRDEWRQLFIAISQQVPMTDEQADSFAVDWSSAVAREAPTHSSSGSLLRHHCQEKGV